MRKFSLYFSIVVLSIICIAVLVALNEVITPYWYEVVMPLFAAIIGLCVALMMYARIRQGDKYSLLRPEYDIETEIKKAGEEESYKAKLDDNNDNCELETSDKIKGEKEPSINILDLHTAFISSEDRLKEELNANSKRATINLIMGSAIGIMGILILFWFVYDLFDVSVDVQNTQIIRSIEIFGARLCVVLLIEFFSFFYLKLYRDCIERTRYYQNELTNIESKKIAILSSAILGDTQHTKAIIEKMLCVERNFIIPKDCTTVELERIRSNSKIDINIPEVLEKLGIKLSSNNNS